MREQTILKALALTRMIDKCRGYRDANIQNLREAPTWYHTELLVFFENRITTYNNMLTRLEKAYQNTVNKLQKI